MQCISSSERFFATSVTISEGVRARNLERNFHFDLVTEKNIRKNCFGQDGVSQIFEKLCDDTQGAAVIGYYLRNCSGWNHAQVTNMFFFLGCSQPLGSVLTFPVDVICDDDSILNFAMYTLYNT